MKEETPANCGHASVFCSLPRLSGRQSGRSWREWKCAIFSEGHGFHGWTRMQPPGARRHPHLIRANPCYPWLLRGLQLPRSR